ncbi:MAG: GTPase HflX [Phycisphaerales bacterium]|nr:GTPase HflX [Phycisphaerales bacterium]
MPPPKERQTIDVRAERAVLAAVRLPGSTYDRANPFAELRALAEQAGAQVVGEVTQMRDRPESGTYMGTGKIEEVKRLCEMLDASVVVFDHELSPKQIAAIEEVVERKIIDRSELILDIFATRAATREAKLQVELAQLEYTYPRLRAMWSHLERITGGSPAGVGTRGPGEQQLEIDRRLVQQRKLALQRELHEIQARKRREVRARRSEHFTVGLVGYTNAGKSTLFNTLTAGGAYADDRLFATLMTRTRQWDLGGGLGVMLSDTVGFVRDLPHNLIASFKATLEEATHADVLLIVLDVSDPACELHYETVTRTLDELVEGVERAELRQADRFAGEPVMDWQPPTRLVLLNKVDRLADNRDLLVWLRRIPDAIPISALPSSDDPHRPAMGGRAVLDVITSLVRGPIREVSVTLPLSAAKAVHTLESRGEVLERSYEGESVTIRARAGDRILRQLRAMSGRITINPLDGLGPAGEPPPPPPSAQRAGGPQESDAGDRASPIIAPLSARDELAQPAPGPAGPPRTPRPLPGWGRAAQ